jgi:hypothetical protein
MGNYLVSRVDDKLDSDYLEDSHNQLELKPVECKSLIEKYGYYLDAVNQNNFDKDSRNSIDIRISPDSNNICIQIDVSGYCRDLTNFSKCYRNLLFNKTINSILHLVKKYQDNLNLCHMMLEIRFHNKSYSYHNISNWNWIIDLNYELIGETKIIIVISSKPFEYDNKLFNEYVRMSSNWPQTDDNISIETLLHYCLSLVFS